MRDVISVFIIILLLPYVVAVFINGQGVLMMSVNTETDKIQVQTGSTSAPLDCDEYLCGVVAYELQEMKESNEKLYPEFLKAQTVIARTRIHKSVKNQVYQETYLDGATMQKRYTAKELEEIERAIQDTESLTLTIDGKLAESPFCFLSNGSTRSGEEVFKHSNYGYLISAECPKDAENPRFMRELTIKYEDLVQLCKKKYPNMQNKLEYKEIEIISKDSAAYILQLRMGNVEISGEEFREILDLPSSSFTLQDYYGKLRIITKGIGHGLGMSQYTGNFMAMEGKSFEEILKNFYKDVEIKSVKDISAKQE